MKKFYLFSIFLGLTFSVFAQNKLSDNIFFKKLPNGLDVLVVEDNSVPIATIAVTFKSGAFAETSQTNGLSAIYQNMLFEANRDDTTEADFNFHLGHIGATSRNCIGTEEYTTSYFTLPSANIDEGLTVMNTAVRFAKIDPGELEKKKKAENDQILFKGANPYLVFANQMDQHLWGQLYYRKEPLGNNGSINATTRQLLIDSVKNKYYYSNNAVLIVGGDVKHDDIFNKVARIYGSWKAADFDPQKKWPVPEFKPLSKSDYFIVVSASARIPYISVQWMGPDTKNDLPSTYPADVLSYILNQNSSKLKKTLVQSGLATNAGFNYLTLKHVGPISLNVSPNPKRIKECMKEIRKQIALMDNDDYLTDEQIETAKRKLSISQIRQQEITSTYIQTLSFWWASASINYLFSYNDNLKKVTRADLRAYIRKYIKDKPFCAGLLIGPDLKSEINAENFFTASNQ